MKSYATLFSSTCLKMTNSLNIISETKRAIRSDINLLSQSLSPDMLDAAMGMKKKKEKKEKDIKKKGGNRKVNPWIAHLQEYRKDHPELSYRECMKAAKPSWIEKRNGKLMSGEPKKKEEKKSPEKEKSKSPSASASPEKTEKEDSENEDKKDDDTKSDNDE